MAEWARLTATTISQYMKGVEEELLTKQLLLAAIRKAGNIVYNSGGLDLNWQVEYRETPLATNNGEQTVTPQRQDRYKRATVPWIGYLVADLMTKRERLINQGGAWQIINYWKNMVEANARNLERQFGLEFYVDSSASGNSGRMSGLESMFATNGTINVTSGAQQAANAADVVGSPNDTYAGLATNLGNYGGSYGTQSDINSTWPAGTGTLNYDFFSPVIVCYNSTTFSASTHTWPNQCLEASRYGIVHMQRFDQNRSAMKMLLLDRSLYRQFLDKQDSKEHMYVESNYSLRKMGFQDVFQQDGVEITWEHGVPATYGYGMNVSDYVELHSMQDKLFVTDGPTYEPLNRAYHVIIDFLGQVKFTKPSRFLKLMPIAA